MGWICAIIFSPEKRSRCECCLGWGSCKLSHFPSRPMQNRKRHSRSNAVAHSWISHICSWSRMLHQKTKIYLTRYSSGANGQIGEVLIRNRKNHWPKRMWAGQDVRTGKGIVLTPYLTRRIWKTLTDILSGKALIRVLLGVELYLVGMRVEEWGSTIV